jgi:uncharacterized protein HemY
MAKILACTKLGIVFMKAGSYPQASDNFKSCSYFRDSPKAWLHTAFKHSQVLDKTGENTDVHRNALPLSTTANLN